MGISMAICELDSVNSLCKKDKETIIKARPGSIQSLEACADYDETVTAEDAKKVFAADWEGFLKRNRLDGERESFLLDKIKKEEDAAKLRPMAKKAYSGWVVLAKMSPSQAQEAIGSAGPDNLLTKWDTIDLEETNAICGRCGMSWDKGRGCIGSFGPDNSQLPDIARKHGLLIVARVPELAKSREKLSATDAAKLVEECRVLKEKLVEEGKGPARRYGGVVERMELMADLCAKNGMRFYFL
ncbi:MAG: hypothetical protein ISF22_08400 [Methanomassiliicoccus sp.]|nr:hypothetical protein [Methanomassiliicoccus sp.]